ncbi:hypothetical protein [Frigoribacterium sp. PhB24]|nr:hypothetical protein [Frigoribacterium sp. PhB24]
MVLSTKVLTRVPTADERTARFGRDEASVDGIGGLPDEIPGQ